ncbi:MAG TPA: pitrilysin family protein [Bryobacteraceae bacterium]|jgi:zinc protease|nr:pitrilysin family protein [Bryobacteraceae bacterium]
MQFSKLDIPCEQFVLDNGLTVLVHEDHKTPIVALNIWYHVGSKNEKPRKTGFAHLFEHLMFGGSEHIRGSYIEAMERAGATDLNGTTSEDRTNYFENVPTSAFDYALFAESDRMGYFYNTINQEVLDLQRGVVQNEKRQGDNQPYAIVEELVVKSTYPLGHPYDHTVIGSMEDLDSASLDDVREWFKNYYTPSNAVLVVAGDITARDAKERVDRYFGGIPSGPPVAHQRSWIAKMSGANRETVEDRVPQARIYKVWNVPGYGEAAADHLRLTAGILSSGKTSRLYKRLVYDEQIATHVAAYLDEREIGSQFVLVATARPDEDLRKVERAMDEELDRFVQEGPAERELARIKTQSYAAFVRGIERIGGFGGKSDILATSQTYLGTPQGYKLRLQHLEEATTADLRATARAWLSDGVYALEVLPFQVARQANGTLASRDGMPALGAAHDLKLPQIHEDRLSNGLRLIVAERHEIPVVNFWLDVDAGYAADQFSLPGAARLTAALLTGGTQRRNALEISDELQMLGAQLTSGCNLDLSTVYLSALKGTLDEALDLYADVILNPTFPEADFRRQQQLQIAAIANEKVTPLQMALRALPPRLFGPQHAYGVPLTGSGTEESVQKLTRENMARFHSTWYKPSNATLIVVGDTTIAELKPKLEQHFSAWKAGDVPSKNLPTIARPQKPAIYLVDKPGAIHSVVVAGTVAAPPNAATEIAYETMNNVFGGTFGARLNMNLREDKHWSYGAGSVLYGARAQRPFLAYASVQGDKTADSISEMLKELFGMAGAKPVREEELDKVKQQQILELPGSHETMNSIGTLLGDLLQLGLPLNFYDSYVTRVAALSVADIERCAKSLLDPRQMIWMVVGDREQVEPALRDLQIGEIIPTEA